MEAKSHSFHLHLVIHARIDMLPIDGAAVGEDGVIQAVPNHEERKIKIKRAQDGGVCLRVHVSAIFKKQF